MTENYYDHKYDDLAENYQNICKNISVAAGLSGRQADDITFLAASKTVPAEIINKSIALGLDHIGENRVQELMDKYGELNLSSCDLQFIGRLQKNKVKYIIDKVSQIQSLDSIELAEEISKQCLKMNLVINVLVEVNIGMEESKGGIKPDELLEFIDKVRVLPGLHVNGLMTIPPICETEQQLRKYFSSMNKYFIDISGKKMDNVNMNCLSMGMSSDYTIAIEEGATMVRIGSSLYGRRQYK